MVQSYHKCEKVKDERGQKLDQKFFLYSIEMLTVNFVDADILAQNALMTISTAVC